MLALDTSRSMSATDVKPSRLAAALASARAFLDVAPRSYAVGIVSFSTRASLVLPPTTDRDAARARSRPDPARLGNGARRRDRPLRCGRAAGRRPAAAAPEETPLPATVLLLSDGEQTSGTEQPLAAAAQARKLGVPVNTVALGTREAVVEVPLPNGLKERVTVAPDTKTLQEIARDHRRPVRGRSDRRAAEADLSRSRQPARQEARGARGHGGVRRRRASSSCSLASGLSLAWTRRPL